MIYDIGIYNNDVTIMKIMCRSRQHEEANVPRPRLSADVLRHGAHLPMLDGCGKLQIQCSYNL